MYRPLNFSMADRISAAKSQTANKTDISAVPTNVTASPGSSTIGAPDTRGLDNAGRDTNSQQGKATQATSQEATIQKTSEANNITYNKPQPNNKSFTEQLLDNQTKSQLNKGTDRPINTAQSTEYPEQQANNIDRPQPDSKTPTRPNPARFDPASIGAPTAKQPSGDLLNKPPTGLPGVNLGPKYSPTRAFKGPNVNANQIPKPKFR